MISATASRAPIKGILLRSKRLEPLQKVGNQLMEDFRELVAVGAEVDHRGGDGGAGRASPGDTIENFLQALLGGIVAEPVIGDAFIDVAR